MESDFKSWLCHLLAVYLGASYSSIIYLVYNVEVIIEPTSYSPY